MDGYTPHTRAGGRKTKLTLSTKEYTKITGTIASVRRSRHAQDVEERGASHSRSTEPSFLAETSFVRAPLNSRVHSFGASPAAKGKAKAKHVDTLDGVPLDIQEALILEDLLYVLMGIEGTYITHHPDYSPEDDDPLQGIQFVAADSLDTSLSDLVDRILPLCTYYTAISSFIEQRSHLDFGLVNHALCAAMREMLKDYQTLLSQLEHAFNTASQFTLQKLWFYVHPTVHTLALIYQLVLELGTADASSSPSASPSPSSSEDEAENEALGLGGAKLRAVLSEIDVDAAASVPVKGGEVLAVLWGRQQSMSGDPTAKAVYGTLLRAAGGPYVDMLRTWVTKGRLVDPYEEMCVKESRFIGREVLEVDYTDEYWERRYTLRDGSTLSDSKRHQAGVPAPRSVGGRLPGGACVPPLLEGWKHKILLAGKYLNVIRECGIEVDGGQQNDMGDADLAMDDERFYTFLENAYTYANATLLQLLVKDAQLLPSLRTLKRHFFLGRATFLTHLLDLAHVELRRPAKTASIVKLQSLLDLTLVDEDAREDIRVSMATSGLYDWLSKVLKVSGVIGGEDGEPDMGMSEDHKKDKEKDKALTAIDALTLDYAVKFPLSLVISRKTILRYQLLFRFLLHLKHVEQSLSAMWIDQKVPVWRCAVPPELAQWRLRVCILRARMLAFVQQILAFSTFEVLEPNWRNLEVKLAKVTTVDQLLRDHVDFLDTCLKECMLTSSRLLKAYSKLIVTCSTFAVYSSMFTKALTQAVSPEGFAGIAEQEANKTKRWDYLAKFETNFNHWFKVHLDCVQFYASSENVALLPLVVRLNSVKTP